MTPLHGCDCSSSSPEVSTKPASPRCRSSRPNPPSSVIYDSMRCWRPLPSRSLPATGCPAHSGPSPQTDFSTAPGAYRTCRQPEPARFCGHQRPSDAAASTSIALTSPTTESPLTRCSTPPSRVEHSPPWPKSSNTATSLDTSTFSAAPRSCWPTTPIEPPPATSTPSPSQTPDPPPRTHPVSVSAAVALGLVQLALNLRLRRDAWCLQRFSGQCPIRPWRRSPPVAPFSAANLFASAWL